MDQGAAKAEQPSEFETLPPEAPSAAEPDMAMALAHAAHPVANAYRDGRWDLVLQLADAANADNGSQPRLMAALALRDWGLSRRLIRQFQGAMEWPLERYRGFGHLDRAILPAAPEQALRKLGRSLVGRTQLDDVLAAFVASFARGEGGFNAWIEDGRAEDQAMAAAADRLRARHSARRKAAPHTLTTIAARTNEAYRNGKWDLVLQLAKTQEDKAGNRQHSMTTLALRDWELSRRSIDRFNHAMGWSDDVYRGFDGLDRRWQPPPDESRVKEEESVRGRVLLRASFLALVTRRKRSVDGTDATALVDRSLAGLGEDVGTASLEADIVRALVRSGTLAEARCAANIATAGYGAHPWLRLGLVAELGHWARTIGRYDLAAPLLHGIVHSQPYDPAAIVEFLRLLHDMELARLLIARLFDQLAYPLSSYGGFSRIAPYDATFSGLMTELQDRLRILLPPGASADATSLLVPATLSGDAMARGTTNDGEDAAARFAERLLSERALRPDEQLAAAVTGDESLPPSAILSALGDGLLRAGQWREAAHQLNHSVSAVDTPLSEVRRAHNRQIPILESYRQHRIIYYNERFYGFYLRAPAPSLGPPVRLTLRLKRMVDAVMAALLPDSSYRRSLKRLHLWSVRLGAWRSATQHRTVALMATIGLLRTALKIGLSPMLRSAKRMTRHGRPLLSPLARILRRVWRLSRSSTARGRSILQRLTRVMRRIFRSLFGRTLHRLRYWRRYPLYQGETFGDVLATIDAAIASGQAKTR